MTHYELLFKIYEIHNNSSDAGQEANKQYRGMIHFMQALRAVVELHRPIEEDGKLWCKHEVCYNHIEFLERDDCSCDYPCPTIQAIEKELG